MKLYRAFATVGGLTLVSRVLGFARDVLLAALLGTGAVMDAFVVAFRLPNLFRRLFGEGAFNAAFVPLYAKRLEGEGIVAANRFARDAMSGLSFILILFSAVMMLAMPWLMLGFAPGFASDPAKYALAVDLTQIAFPYLLCMSLVALLSGVLNSLERFWAAAAAPILLNVVLVTAIVIALWLGLTNQPGAGYILAIGVFIAGFVQLAMLWIAAARANAAIGLSRPRWTPEMRRLVVLGVPGLIAGGITQINITVGTIIASLQESAVSYLFVADRFYQLPLGIVGIAIGVVLLPDLSRKLRAGDWSAAIDSQNRSLEFAILLTLPSAVGLALAAEPIISILFERMAFTAESTVATAHALVAFSLGLPAFVLIKVFQPAFFAREDTATPMWLAGVNLVVNVIGSLSLFYYFREIGWQGHVGIALATSIAGWVNAILLWAVLAGRGAFAADTRLLRNLALIIFASVLMGTSLVFLLDTLAPHLDRAQSLIERAAALAALIGGGAAVFFAVMLATGVVHYRMIFGGRTR
ncbi:MAG: murein biosynthesis integral membrane protein MurJ [Pseudomonadota bacterium]